ncbi:MAG: hypothetical protein PHU23_14650 [Dehalococcoidales bacterium]|nr:hypothetical protein [Dehalococcoidales bacterium]
MDNENRPLAFAGFMGALATGILLWCIIPRYFKLTSKAFFQPASVSKIAASLPYGTEDEFVLAAWNYVGNLPYENLGSNMEFYGDVIQCADCYLGSQAVQRQKGNCVSKSSLLASILANRMDINRLKLVVGDYEGEKNQGHMWVEWWRIPQNNWYILESTAQPQYPDPWMMADDYTTTYIPSTFISLDEIECLDNNYCRT